MKKWILGAILLFCVSIGVGLFILKISLPPNKNKTLLATVYNQEITKNQLDSIRKASKFSGSDSQLLNTVIEYYLVLHYFNFEKLLVAPKTAQKYIDTQDLFSALPILKNEIIQREGTDYKAEKVSIVYCDIGTCTDQLTIIRRRGLATTLLNDLRKDFKKRGNFDLAFETFLPIASQSAMPAVKGGVDPRFWSDTIVSGNDYWKQLKELSEQTNSNEISINNAERPNHDLAVIYIKSKKQIADFNYDNWLNQRFKANVIIKL